MKPVVAVVIAVLMAEAAFADMAAPLSRSIATTNTVTLAEPMTDYVFFAVDQPIGRHVVPISFVPNAPIILEPHGYRGTVLLAVPRSFAERFKTPDEMRNAMRDEQPAGVSSVELPGDYPKAAKAVAVRRGVLAGYRIAEKLKAALK